MKKKFLFSEIISVLLQKLKKSTKNKFTETIFSSVKSEADFEKIFHRHCR